jgi:hypothetical protein
MWFKSNRTKELEKLFNDSVADMASIEKKLVDTTELVKLYKKQIDVLSEKPTISPEHYVHVPVPQTDEDMRALQLKIAQLTSDTLYLFYFADLRRKIIQQFESESGRQYSEYFRGQLAFIGQIFEDSAKARKHIGN